MPEAEVPALIARARVIALPYRWIEGSGVFASALALGVPPVVTAVGTFPELCAEYDLCEPVRARRSGGARRRARADADRSGGARARAAPEWRARGRS